MLAALVNFCGFFWAGGIAMRFRTIQAGPLMQMPVFLILFFAPVYVPLELLEGWIHGVATVNPVTYLLETGRGFVAGDAPHIAGAFAIAIGLGLALLDLGVPRPAQRRGRGRLASWRQDAQERVDDCGSNCVPEASTSRRLASSSPSDLRYGRSVVIAWYASQARTIRDSSGICSPARWSG